MRYIILLLISTKWTMHKLFWIITKWSNSSYLAKCWYTKFSQNMERGNIFRWFGFWRWKVDGKLLWAATDETSSSVFVPVNFYSKPPKLQRGRMCKQHVTCMHAHTHTLKHTHIARPCPSAAGDYVDYRMIRTPPSPPLPPWFYTGPGHTAEIWRKTSCVLSITEKKVSFSHWDLNQNSPTLLWITARRNKEASHEKDRQASSRFRSVH